jgi:hypothetical protein
MKSRRLKSAGRLACVGERRGRCIVLVGNSEERRPLGRLRRRWEDIFKMDIREVGWRDIDWIYVA